MDALNTALAPLVTWVKVQPGAALALLLVLQVVGVALGILGIARARRLAQRQSLMLRGVDGASLESLLLDYSGRVTQFDSRLDQALSTSDSNTNGLRQALRRVGLHHYDAFSNVGGQQSFSLALLDDAGNGVVLSGLYSRQDMRVYAKPILQGQSTIALTPEEQRALAEARQPKDRG